MGAIESLFEKVDYDPKKLENYRLHYWFQERYSVCLFFSEKGAMSNFFSKKEEVSFFFEKGAVGPKRLGIFASDLNILHYRWTFILIVFEKTKTFEIQKNSENSKLYTFFVIQDSWNSDKKEQRQWMKNHLRWKNIGISNVEMLRERSVFVFNDIRTDRNSETTV